jgi:chemotaxis protein MotB
MITLLLAFFAVLIAVSYVDLNLWEQMKQGLRSEINKQENVQTPLAEVKKDLDEKLAEEREAELVDIILDREGIKLFFNSSSFYNSGEANLLPTGQQIIDKVTQAMNDLGYYKFKVDVEGHSDNVPINTPVYPSNWELSVARASGVVKYFIQEGIEPERIKASGYADTKPIVPHVDEAGNDIVENRALNRRIVIRIYY